MIKNFLLFSFTSCMMLTHVSVGQTIDYDKKLKELGIELIPATKPIANYVKAVRTGNLLFLAGHGPSLTDGTVMTGKLGQNYTVEQGYQAARQTAISLISTLKNELGDLNKVKRIVKVLGMVNCTPEFTDQPKVMNGCSDLFSQVFGEKGKHARSAVGMNALPLGMAVEVEIIVEIE